MRRVKEGNARADAPETVNVTATAEEPAGEHRTTRGPEKRKDRVGLKATASAAGPGRGQSQPGEEGTGRR